MLDDQMSAAHRPYMNQNVSGSIFIRAEPMLECVEGCWRIHAVHPPFSIGQTLIPILRALSTRLALIPLPGQAITALGRASSI
jgi:hypothetical protein